MATTMVNFRMDKDLKREMESVCKQMGMTMSAAFTIFAKTVSREKRIPFDIYAEQPNALIEIENGGSAAGILKKYADSKLISEEKTAWNLAVKKKYEKK